MNGLAPSSPRTPDHPVWHSLSRYTVGPAAAALPFVVRLARDNAWSPDRAERIFDEYRRFCFLAVTAGHEVTPSDAVDQVWHLHLTYTRDYWDRFCPEVLGRPLHHGPTMGGADERSRFHAQYARTLKSYEAAFGEPPADVWPGTGERARDDHRARRVHPRDALIVPRAALRLSLLLLAVTTAGGLALLWSLT